MQRRIRSRDEALAHANDNGALFTGLGSGVNTVHYTILAFKETLRNCTTNSSGF